MARLVSCSYWSDSETLLLSEVDGVKGGVSGPDELRKKLKAAYQTIAARFTGNDPGELAEKIQLRLEQTGVFGAEVSVCHGQLAWTEKPQAKPQQVGTPPVPEPPVPVVPAPTTPRPEGIP